MTRKTATPRVLLVEDEPHVRMLERTLLEDAGYVVDEAGGGDEAVAAIKKRPYAAIVLDIMMPGTDGYSVLEQLKEMPKRRGTPVIVVTARHDPSSVIRELAGGAFDHLAKPFTAEALVSAVTRAIEGGDVEERRATLWRSAQAYDTAALLRSTVPGEMPVSTGRRRRR